MRRQATLWRPRDIGDMPRQPTTVASPCPRASPTSALRSFSSRLACVRSSRSWTCIASESPSSRPVAEPYRRLADCDAEYKASVTSLVGLRSAVEGQGDVVQFVDVDSFCNVVEHEAREEDRDNIRQRRDQLRGQIQNIAKGIFSGSINRAEAINAEHANYIKQLNNTRKAGADGAAAAEPGSGKGGKETVKQVSSAPTAARASSAPAGPTAAA
eukprot:4566579-Pyramimonas_sp.AAC.1